MIEYKRLADVKNETELEYIISEWKDRFSKIPDEVENLVKLIKLRLLATKCSISVIREAANFIRIYSPFTQYEWNILKNNINRDILRRVKFTMAPKSCNEGKSILLINIEYLAFEEMFNILSSLFYDIEKGVSSYISKN